MKLAEAIRKAKHVYLCGNGGSAANAIHIANDLVSCGIKAHALTADVATMTAIANDHCYEDIFRQQIRVFGERGDLLIAMSGSGKSENILRAVIAAEIAGMDVFTIFGNERGEDMQTAEEMQIRLGHDAMRWLKANP